MTTGRRTLAAFGVTLFTATPLRAESEPSPADSEEPIEVVVTGTRTKESSQRATVRTRVVTRQEAERRGATNVAEALATELGVQVNPGSYGYLGGPSAIQIQGFDRERVLILEDGERVIGDQGGAIDLSRLSLSGVSHIEYVTGPTSSLYGTAAIGGVVNVITRPPDYPGSSARARLEGRSRRGVYADATGAHRFERSWASIDGSFSRQDGIALDPSLPDLVQPEIRRHAIGARGGASLGRDVELTLKARWMRDERFGLSSQEFPGIGRFLVDLPERADRVALQAIERIELGKGSSITLSAGRQWYRANSTKDRRQSPIDEERSRTQDLHSYEMTAVAADGERTWVFGVRYEDEALGQSLSKTESVSGSLVTTEVDEVEDLRLGSIAGYAQLGYRPRPELSLMPGVRFEQHRRFGGVVAPRLAAAWAPTEPWLVRVSGGRGFRAPSANEYGFAFDHSFLGYVVMGNPKLEPETSWGVNGDVTLRADSRTTLRAGAYANWVEELIDVRFARQLPGGVQEFRYENLGRARTYGLEFDVRLRPTPAFQSELGYAYLFARDDENHAPLPSRPPHTLRARISAELVPRLRVDAVWKGVSDSFVALDVTAPGFHTLDLRIAHQLSGSLELFLGALNVLGTQRDPRRIGDQRPVPGRVLYLGVTTELPEAA